MSRNSSVRVASDWRAARAIKAAATGSTLLRELVGRDRYRDLARLRVEPVGKHEHAAVDQAAQHGHHYEESKQARHVATPCRGLFPMKEWRNYDHVPAAVTRGSWVVSVLGVWKRGT